MKWTMFWRWTVGCSCIGGKVVDEVDDVLVVDGMVS